MIDEQVAKATDQSRKSIEAVLGHPADDQQAAWYKYGFTAGKKHSDEDTLAALKASYLVMLQMPMDGLRLRYQLTMVDIRNAIAGATGRDPEGVQTEFERRAVVALQETRQP